MAEHTPTPWRINGNSIWSNDGYVAELSCPRGPDMRDADAAFIVKAVNRDHHFDALVKALEAVAAAKMPGEARRIAVEALRAVAPQTRTPSDGGEW
jgi:hypothetical protein